MPWDEGQKRRVEKGIDEEIISYKDTEKKVIFNPTTVA